jgi:hypothetical protein
MTHTRIYQIDKIYGYGIVIPYFGRQIVGARGVSVILATLY